MSRGGDHCDICHEYGKPLRGPTRLPNGISKRPRRCKNGHRFNSWEMTSIGVRTVIDARDRYVPDAEIGMD